MRPQRTLRTSSAQSLCIFCACRLGVDVPSTQLAPFVSANARRTLSTTRGQQQSVAAASSDGSENANNNAPGPSTFEFDPKSSLTRAEQQERARRSASRQEQEVRQQQARQGQIWKDQEARLPFSESQALKSRRPQNFRQDNGAGVREKRAPFSKRINTSDPASASTGAQNKRGVSGAPLSQRLFNQKKENLPNPNIQDAKEQTPFDQTAGNGSARRTGKREQAQAQIRSAADRRGQQLWISPNTPRPARVTKPTFLTSSQPAQGSQQVSGWGMGTTETKPLEYGDGTQPRPTVYSDGFPSQNPNPAIQDLRLGAKPQFGYGWSVGSRPQEDPEARRAMEQSRQGWLKDTEAQKAMEQSKQAWRTHISQETNGHSAPRECRQPATSTQTSQPLDAAAGKPFGERTEESAPSRSQRSATPTPQRSDMDSINQAINMAEQQQGPQEQPAAAPGPEQPDTARINELPIAPTRRPQLHFSMSDAQEYKYDRDYSNQDLGRASGPYTGFPHDRFARSETRTPMSNRYDARYDSSTPEAPQTYSQRPQPSYAPVSQRDEYNPEYRISETRSGRPAPSAYDGNWSSFEDEQSGDAGPDSAQYRPAPSAANSSNAVNPRHFGDELSHSQYGQESDQLDQAGQTGGVFDDSYDGIPLDAAQRRPEPHPSEFSRYPQHVPRNARTFGFEEEHRRDPYYAQQQPPPSRLQSRNEAPPPSRFSGSFQNYENIQYDAPANDSSEAQSRQYQRPFMGADTHGSFESDSFYESQFQYPGSDNKERPDQAPQRTPLPSRQAFGAPHYHQDDQRRGAFGYDGFGHAQSAPQQPQQYQDYDRRGVSQPFGDGFHPPSQVTHDDNDDGGQASFYDRQPAPHRPMGYRAVPIDPRELGQNPSQAEEDNSANWQHLRRRNSEPVAPPAQYQSHRQQGRALSVQDIDQIFANHQQQRDTYNTPPPPQPPSDYQGNAVSRNIFGNTDRANKRCARCGEMGHLARECPRAQRAPRSPNQFGASADGQQDSAPRIRFTGGEVSRDVESQAQKMPYRPAFQPRSTDTGDESRFQPRRIETAEEDRRPAVEETRPAQEEESKRSSRRDRWVDEDDDVQERESYGSKRKERRNKRQARDEDDEDQSARDEYRARKAERQSKEEAERRANVKAARREREARKAEQATPVTLPEFISVQNLSQVLGVRYEQFVEHLEELGYDDVFPGKTLNSETSGMIAMEYNFEPTFDTGAREEEERDLKPRPEVDDKELLPVRPPVVTIMGHVDHGKTTILDYLRKSSVAAGEAGGITQHIGAFSVPLSSSGKTITFLDTPGHAAFLAMRQRGANVTDLVILVVAADDSVKPQTLEALKHAKSAGVPIIVAINKIDKPEADIERVKQDLARHGVEIEDFGGETQVVPVSGKTGAGMDQLEENVVTLSEILDHRAETDGLVEGWVLEATTKKAGRVATILVRRGTLRPGSVIVAGKTWARVRSLKNEGGQTLQEVGPGMPVEVDGWKDQPMAGDEVLQAPSEQKANSVVEYRLELEERQKTASDMEAINEARRIEQEKRDKEKAAEQAAKRAASTAEGGEPVSSPAASEPTETQSGQMVVPFIIKADVSGSAEAVSAYILSVSNPLIAPQILSSSVGAVHESDIELANAAEGHIIAFNLPQDPDMMALAESRGVKILENDIIYRVLDDVKAVLEEKLPPIVTQRVLGEAEVSASFEISLGGRKKMKIAGCKVRNGLVAKNARVRITRNGEKVYDGTINSLKNVKKDVQEMRKGSECGMGFDEWEGFEVGDQVQTYAEVEEKRKL